MTEQTCFCTISHTHANRKCCGNHFQSQFHSIPLRFGLTQIAEKWLPNFEIPFFPTMQGDKVPRHLLSR